MRTVLTAGMLALSVSTAAFGQTPDAVKGDWYGVLNGSLHVVLHVGQTITFDSPDQGVFGLPGTFAFGQFGGMVLTLPGAITYSFDTTADEKGLDGTFHQNGAALRLTFTHTPPPPAVTDPREREVSIDGGKAPLYGTLLTPPPAKPGPAFLFLAGSGPTDRNSNSTEPGVHPDTFRLMALALADKGITTLRIDKRAIGKSGPAAPAEADLRLSTYVNDAVAWARYLKTQPGVTCVVVLGHSEGALVGTLAAEQIPACGFVSVSGAGRTFGAVLRDQLAAGGLAPEQLNSADEVIGELEQGRTVPGVPATDALFRPSVQPYLISEMTVDPAAELKKVPCPVLIIQGGNDIQVSVQDAQLLAAARPDARLVILPGANHVLKIAPRDRAGNVATYADPALPLAPGLVDAIATFVAGLSPG